MESDCAIIYRNYIACRNKQDWQKLGQFVDDDVQPKGRQRGLSGCREMLVGDFGEIPDLRFNILLLISD